MKIKSRAGRVKPSRSRRISLSPLSPNQTKDPCCSDDGREDNSVLDTDNTKDTGGGEDSTVLDTDNRKDIGGGEGNNVPDTDNHEDIVVQHGDKVLGCDTRNSAPERSQDGCLQDISCQESVEIHILELRTCLKCGKGDRVLVCTEASCPIAIHEKCLSTRPEFDIHGNFYCPYCSYKRAVAKVHELRRKAALAKKALSNFLDNGLADEGQQKDQIQNSGRDKGELCDVYPAPTHENYHNNMNNEKNPNVQHQENPENSDASKHKELDENLTDTLVPCANDEGESGDEEGIPEEEMREDAKNQCKGVSDQQDAEISDPCNSDEEAAAVLHELSEAKGRCKNVPADQGQRKKGKRRKPQSNETLVSSDKEDFATDTSEETNIDSEVSDSDVQASSLSDRDSPRVITRGRAQAKKVGSPRKLSSQSDAYTKKGFKDKKKLGTAEKSRQQQQSPKILPKPSIPNVKRRRLHWSAEEEDMLKEGVRSFSSNINKNIPWRKILELGSQVFDPTRTPSDLKDKWKNMTSKRL